MGLTISGIPGGLKLSRYGWTGVGIVGVVAVVALFAPLLAPMDPTNTDLANALQGPSAQHLLGTDQLGRDVLSRVIVGARMSAVIGVLSVGIAAVGGLLIGLTTGYFGGKYDSFIMRLLDVMLAFPSMLFALLLIGLVGTNITNVIVAIGVLSIAPFARLVRTVALSASKQDYVKAATVVGCSNTRIVLRYILPNSLSAIIVQGTFLAASAILIAASLSFLGLGVPPPTPEWGQMLGDGRSYLSIAPHLTLVPGVALLLTILGLNLVGDALRDALDPKTRYGVQP